MEGSFNLLLDKGTLQEAIANDRRITSRNIFKWIDQVLNVLLVYHRSFMSVGEFGLLDVSIGYSKQLKDLVAFEESLLAVLKANHNAVEALKVKNSVAERELIEDERIATLDFKRRILLHQSKLSEAAKHQELVVRSETTTATEKRALPRGFLSSKLLKFDYKHDNNVCIPKDIEDHEVLVEAFHEYVVNVCQDYRCLGIVILQIYSMCVFPADECARLMRYQAPDPPKQEEELAEEDSPVQTHRKSLVGGPLQGTGEGGRRASVSVSGNNSSGGVSGTGGKSSIVPPSSSTPATASKPTPAATADASASAAVVAAVANAAAGAELNKKKKARQPRLPNVLEQQLLTMYPCIERMPTEIKELFLDICFVRPESVLTERSIKARGEICTKLEFSLLPMVKNIKFALHAVVEQLREDVHFEPQCYWTAADERARIAAHKEREERYAQLAQQGPLNAQRRLQHERYLLWYSLQSDDFRAKMEARRKARKKAERNIIMRRKYIYLATFHKWTMLNFTSWIHEALFEYSTMLHGLYRNALLEKKKKHKEKKPAVYVVRLINDLLAVYTKTAVAKLVAYQSKRQEEDSLGWEDSIRLIKPSTSGGPRPGTRGESAVAKITAKMGTDTGTGASSSSLSATVHFQKDSVALSSTSTASKPTESDSAPPLPPPPGMLPDILKRSASASRGGEVRSRNNGRQRKVVEQVKPKTEEEVLTECFAVLASQLALLMSQKMRNPAEMCRFIRQAVAAQEKETAEARAERMLVTSEEQLYFKRISMQAGYFTASAKYLRNCALEFSDAIDLLDRGWIKFVVYLTSCAVLHQYHRDAPNRARGEIYAADRIVAFFRRIVIRNIVSRVWKRTNLMFMSSLSPQSSKTNSPAMALRKQMAQGLGSNSGDTPNSGGSRKRSRPQHQPQQPQQQQKCVSISSDHSLPTTKSEKLVPTKQTTIPERRKPFFIREVVAPSGKTLLVDMSVSIESDELIDANEVNIRVARRQAARYEAWKNIECSAYIETDVTQEPAGISAKQAIADSALYSASAFHSSAAAASSTSTAASANIIPGKGIENPIPRRLIVHLGRKNSMHQEQRKENECIKYCPVKATLTVVEHTAAAPGAGDDATSLGDSSLHSNTFQNSGLSNYKTPNSMLQAAKAAAGHNLQERRQSAAELAWEESGALKAVPMGSSGIHPHGPAGQPVITYHLALDNLLAYSCYSVQFVLDKHLADDIKDGNKSFFRYLSHMDDDDDLSMESESNAEVTFAQVGKQWVIQDNQSTDTEEVALSPLKAHQIDADADADADARLRVELAQYVYTRPAVPRSVKGLTARVAYHSADASYAYSAADQTPIIQYTPAVAAATSEREVMRTLQGGVDVRWLQSVEDAHSHTHYEVQRRLLLINCAQTAPALNLLPASGAGRNLSAKKGRKDRTVNEAVPASTPLAPQSVEELIYVGPWKHVAGLKSSLRNAGRNSAASVASLASAGTMGSTSTAMASSKGGVSHNNNSSNNNLIGGAAGAPDWSFLSASTPHHSTHCTDRVSLPAELDANPDAYNLVMGFLCARFPDLVLQDADSGSQQIGDAQQANAEAGLLLQRVVESGLVVGLEYRVRAINSAGLGKFSACTANLPIFQSSTAQPSYHPSSSSSVTASGVASRQVNGVCTVQLARVFAHLAQLCDFRTKHPKYRSQNNDLVGMVLAQRAETAKAADTQFIERSGDPFVDYLLDLKDGEKGEDATLSGKLAKEKASNKVNEEEMDVISAWIHSLELECPIK